MKNPPAATAAVAAHDPVRAVVPAQAMAVVTRWPPGLMLPFSRNARAVTRNPFSGVGGTPRMRSGVPGMGRRLPVRPRVLYTGLPERFPSGGDGCRGMARWRAWGRHVVGAVGAPPR